MESATPCQRRRSSESTKVRTSLFPLLSFLYLNDYSGETRRFEGTGDGERPHTSIRRYRHYRGGDGGGNLIFNERVAGTGGDTHDRPKVSTTSLLDARGTRGRKFVAGGRKKMIEIAREGCVTSQIPSKLNRVFLPSQLGPPARSTFSFYLYGRANSLMAPSSATRRKAT